MIYFISDMHFGHANILTFEGADGKKLRPDFHSVEEMDMKMISNWNAVVKDTDKVYVLGDIAMKKHCLEYFKILKGEKILIRGNHDTFDLKHYLPYFKDIRGAYAMNQSGLKALLTHIPVNEGSIGRWGVNLHGHLHEKNLANPRYINLSVEQINFTPISIDKVKEIIKERGLEA